jgi:predicted AlkP superfamily pyrophosphatase or phosphodiesterase
VSDHVVIISIDGLRPDAIERFGANTLLRLAREGASAEARTIYPSKTLPSHTSMLTGLLPEEHGITWNSDRTDEHGEVSVVTVFEEAKRHGYTTAAFFSKSKFHHLQKKGTLDYTQAPDGSEKFMATRTVEDVVRYLKYRRPNVLFVHIGEPDFAGHSLGWMSEAYGWAVRRADAAVERVLESADEAYGRGEYTVIVTADHGGNGHNHGSEADTDMSIPWVIWGEGVEHAPVATAVRTMDTAATTLWLLGLAPPPAWTGQPVAGAFTTAARTLAEQARLKRSDVGATE